MKASTKNSSSRIQQLEQEAIERRAGIADARAEHAVAGVEQHAETDRHAFAGELRDGLRLAVLEYLEGFALEPAHQMTLGVEHGRVDTGQIDARPEQPPGPHDDVLRRERGTRQNNRRRQERVT